MKKNNQKTLFSAPGGKSYLVPFILITSLFLLWGFAHGLLDVLNKHFQGVFTMTKAESGLVQFSTYIAYFLMALPAGMFMKRFGYKKGIILGLCLFAAGAFAFIPAAYLHSASPFLVALFVIACGLCILETAANPYSTILGPKESGAQRLNLSQSFNGLGWILGPLVGGMLIFGGEESDPFTLTKPYILVGSVVLLVAILFIFTKLPEVQVEEDTDAEEKEHAPASGAVSMWRHPQFVRSIVAQFCYCAAQTGIFSFFINYVTEVETTMTNIEASRILAFGGMALFMIGRLSGSFTMKWMSPARLVVCIGGCYLYGIGSRFYRYGFFVCSLSVFLLHVYYVPDDLCPRPGRNGSLHEESFFLYCDGSGRRRFCPDADGIYRCGQHGGRVRDPAGGFFVYSVLCLEV